MGLWTTATANEEARRAATVAVLPIGSFEQHGSHLPLATDTIVASAIAAVLAERYNLFLLPPVTMSCSHEHAAWPGTVSISARTLSAIVTDVAESLRLHGVEHLVLVNGHGGNYFLSNLVQEANVGRPRLALFPARADWDKARNDAELATSGHDDMHARLGSMGRPRRNPDHDWPGLVRTTAATACRTRTGTDPAPVRRHVRARQVPLLHLAR